MKTTVVPAQVTTVEDRIIGRLTFTQIMFLVIPLLTATATYLLFPPQMQFSLLKTSLIVLQPLVFVPLAIRIRQKTLSEWLLIILRFKSRPRLYLFTKNDLGGRKTFFADSKQKHAPKKTPQKEKKASQDLSPKEELEIDQILKEKTLIFSFKKKERRF